MQKPEYSPLPSISLGGENNASPLRSPCSPNKTLSRFVTCEADKTIKIWRENSEATEDSHPIDMKSWSAICLAQKRF
jgi:hypothetical protein